MDFLFSNNIDSVDIFKINIIKLIKKAYGSYRLRRLILEYYEVENEKGLNEFEIKLIKSVFGNKILMEVED